MYKRILILNTGWFASGPKQAELVSLQSQANGFLGSEMLPNTAPTVIVKWNTREDYENFVKSNAQALVDANLESENYYANNNINVTISHQIV